jgi:hypothetical protein
MQPMQHCTVSVLLVMYGLPRLLIGSIVAHELMHAYMRMRNVAGLPLQVCGHLDGSLWEGLWRTVVLMGCVVLCKCWLAALWRTS